MRIVVFFVYLCSLLLTANQYSHAAITHTPLAHSTGTQKFIKDAVANTEDGYLVADDYQDDDDDTTFARKCKLPARYEFSNTLQFVLNYLHNSFPPPSRILRAGIAQVYSAACIKDLITSIFTIIVLPHCGQW